MECLLIDFESVQPESIAALEKDKYTILVFVGANQSKVPFTIASALQAMGNKAEYIKITGHGRNALDFHIAFYMGQISATQKDARFVVVSKDGGFDPLIEHLNAKGIKCRRISDVSELVAKKSQPAKSNDDPITVITTRLLRPAATKPRTVKTLSNHIRSWFKNQDGEIDVEALVKTLADQGIIAIQGDKISYPSGTDRTTAKD